MRHWWEDPQWLKEERVHWPKSIAQLTEIPEVPEIRNQAVMLMHVENSYDVMLRYAPLSKLKRIIASYFRLKTNCAQSKSKSPLMHEPITIEEL